MEIPKIILKPTINAICRIESMFWPIIIGIILIVSFFIQEIYHLAYITIILFVYKTCVEISKSKKTIYTVTKDSIYFGTDSKPDTNPLFIKDIKELWLKQSFFQRKFNLGTIIISLDRLDEYGHMRVAIQDIKNPYNVMSTLCNLISKDSYEEEKITLQPDKNSIYPYFQDTVFGFILGLAASIIAVLIWISSGAELFDKKYNPHSDIPYIITVCILVFTVFYPPYGRFMRKQKIYKIGKNTIQSKEGIINHNLKIIHTKNTKGIILKRGPFEKKYNLGNIKIFSTVRNGEIGREEIIMENLKNADKIYEKLKNFLDNDNTNDNIITPKYCIRPHFSPSAQMFPVVIVTSLILIITSAVEFCIDYSFSNFIYYFIPALFISALTGYIIMCANYISCKNTKYNFYPDKAENVKRIFEEKKACVYYGNIYRVTTRENYFQKLNNMGSIYLVTADTKSKKFEFLSSIKFVDIKYAKDLCKKINEDIEKTKNKLFT